MPILKPSSTQQKASPSPTSHPSINQPLNPTNNSAYDTAQNNPLKNHNSASGQATNQIKSPY
jgi:hypothetical protein